MTRIPDLERELAAAAQRRYGPSRRRRRVPAWVSPRLLAPVACLLLIAMVAGTALRVTDPEVEAPPRPAEPQPSLAELRQGPLSEVLGDADPSVEPVSVEVDPWLAVAFGGPDETVCLSSTGSGRPAAGCTHSASLRGVLRHDASAHYERVDTMKGQLVFGLVEEGAKAVKVELAGEDDQEAVLSAQLLTTRITRKQLQTVSNSRYSLGSPGIVRFRLFAAHFPRRTSDPVAGSIVVTDRQGETATTVMALGPGDDEVAVGCYSEASVDADTAAPGGGGDPVDVCRRFWDETGFAGEPEPDQLTACDGNGVVSVFPGGPEVCARLGLEPY